MSVKKLKQSSFEPVISIITPFLNAGEYIEETAKSVLGQTFPLFEWIIVDDGSEKKDINKLMKLHEKDKRIKIIYAKEKRRRCKKWSSCCKRYRNTKFM